MAPLIPPTSYVTGDNMYENMLDLLVEAKLNRNNPARGESMRFFNKAYDSGAMKDFIEPDYPLNASAREVDFSVFDETRNDPAIQNLGDDDILFTLSRNSPSWHPVGYASYYPTADWALHQVQLPQNEFLRAMAAASSTYNIPAVDMNMQTLLQDFGSGKPKPIHDISKSVSQMPESIRPDVLNFLSRPYDDAAGWVATGDSAGKFALDSDQAIYFNQDFMKYGTGGWDSIANHEAGHILDRGLAGVQQGRGATDWLPFVYSEDNKRDFMSEQDEYRNAIEKDQTLGSIKDRFPDSSNDLLIYNAGGETLDITGDFITGYSKSKSHENVEDFAERFMLYLNDKEDGWVVKDILSGKKLKFAELYPETSKYFDDLLRRNAVMDALIPSRA